MTMDNAAASDIMNSDRKLMTEQKYQRVIEITITSFDVCIAKKLLGFSMKTDNSGLTYVEKILSFYLKYEPVDLFKSDVVKSITEEVFTDPDIYSLVFNQSIKMGLELSNTEFKIIDIPLFITDAVQKVQKNKAGTSLIPQEVLTESTTDVDMVYTMLKNNFWYVCIYLTICYITQSNFYDSVLKKPLSKTGV